MHLLKALQAIIVTALDHTEKIETGTLRLENLEVLINAILYNPSAALQLIESSRPGMSRMFFDKWFAAINSEEKLPRVHDKKLSILALCALLEMNPSGIPATLNDGWPGIVAGALKIFKDLPGAIESKYWIGLDVIRLVADMWNRTQGARRCLPRRHRRRTGRRRWEVIEYERGGWFVLRRF
jgi:hypothetical protein